METRARLVLLAANQDAALAEDLERMFKVLEAQGRVSLWSRRHIEAGQVTAEVTAQALTQADIILLLISAGLLSEESPWIQMALAQRLRGAQVVPILGRPALLPEELSNVVPLPRNYKPLTTWVDRDVALLAVVQGVEDLLGRRASPPPAPTPPVELAPGIEPPPAQSAAPRRIDEIFRLDGLPDQTFVEPEQFRRLHQELGHPGRGLLVEGPSKAGKTTAVRHILRRLKLTPREVHWLDGKELPAEDALRALLDRLQEGGGLRHVLIDDFHFVENPRLVSLIARRVRALTDAEHPDGKLTLIGVNPLGDSLLAAVPDLRGRCPVVSMQKRQPDVRIAELIVKGEAAAQVRFVYKDEFIREAEGSFYIAQLLCQRALAQLGILTAQSEVQEVALTPSVVIRDILDEMDRYWGPLLRRLASYDQAAPPRGGTLALLWLLSRLEAGHVTIEDAVLRFGAVGAALRWLGQSNLRGAFVAHPELSRLFFYSPSAGTLTLEDPVLRFYLRKLDFAQLARDTGHTNVSFDASGELLIGGVSRVQSAPPSASSREGAAERGLTASGEALVLHLSDLHFRHPGQAPVWYSQLALDLRELGCTALDALVVTGDVAERAAEEEYAAARIFLEQLMAGFSLAPDRVLLCPGNHDVSWPLSREAYKLHDKASYRIPLEEGAYIVLRDEDGAEALSVREESAYKLRFQPFSRFYREVKGTAYPLDYEQQAQVLDLAAQGLVLVGLNSAWQIDHHKRFQGRASIHGLALARALRQLHAIPAERLRIAAWHHPVGGSASDSIKNAGFLQQLAQAGVRVVLHGHVHQLGNQLYRHDMTEEGRRVDLVGAGTFGAARAQWVPGYPAEYNLLRVRASEIIVETRCRTEEDGAFRPYAHWLKGPGADPSPRYRIPR